MTKCCVSGRKKDMAWVDLLLNNLDAYIAGPVHAWYSHWLDRCSKRNDSHCIYCYICHRWTLNACAELVWMSWRLLSMRRFQKKTEDNGIRQERLAGLHGGWEINLAALPSPPLFLSLPEVWKAAAEEMSRPFNALTVMLKNSKSNVRKDGRDGNVTKRAYIPLLLSL